MNESTHKHIHKLTNKCNGNNIFCLAVPWDTLKQWNSLEKSLIFNLTF